VTVAITGDLATGTVTSSQSGTDALSEIEALIGGEGNDTSPRSNPIRFPAATATTAVGRRRQRHHERRQRSDTFSGANGFDSILGSNGDRRAGRRPEQRHAARRRGNDTVTGGNGRIICSAEAANDSIVGGVGNDDSTAAMATPIWQETRWAAPTPEPSAHHQRRERNDTVEAGNGADSALEATATTRCWARRQRHDGRRNGTTRSRGGNGFDSLIGRPPAKTCWGGPEQRHARWCLGNEW